MENTFETLVLEQKGTREAPRSAGWLAPLLGRLRTLAHRQAAQRNPILEDINLVLAQMKANQQQFDLVGDGDLLDAIIYEQNALMARYSYLLKTARQAGVKL